MNSTIPVWQFDHTVGRFYFLCSTTVAFTWLNTGSVFPIVHHAVCERKEEPLRLLVFSVGLTLISFEEVSVIPKKKFRSFGDSFTSFLKVSLLFTDENRVLHCTMELTEKWSNKWRLHCGISSRRGRDGSRKESPRSSITMSIALWQCDLKLCFKTEIDSKI
jgi:hypothetical protein